MHLPPELLNPATWRTWSGWVFGDRALPSEVITTLFFCLIIVMLSLFHLQNSMISLELSKRAELGLWKLLRWK